MAKTAAVAVSFTTRDYDKLYSYILPPRLENIVVVGSRVIVPFGPHNKTVEAFVFEIKEEFNEQNTKLKEIIKVIDLYPILNNDMIPLAIWMKERYICTYFDAIKCMMPPGTSIRTYRIFKLINESKTLEGLNQGKMRMIELLGENGGECESTKLKQLFDKSNYYSIIKALKECEIIAEEECFSSPITEKTMKVAYLNASAEIVQDEIESNNIKNIKHIRVLEMLLDNDFISVRDLTAFASVTTSVLNTLNKKGLIAFKDIEVKRDPFSNRVFSETQPMEPTNEQHQALEYIQTVLNGTYKEVLLHGVTGSGKTEVYMQIIQKSIEAGKQAIMLVPEISLTPQTVQRFKGRFGKYVAVLHSRLSLGERYDQWRLIKEGKIRVVIGARSAVFAPLNDLGVVIVDEEHESSYKSETTPKYHAVDIAKFRCKQKGAVLIEGSATPLLSSYYHAEKGDAKLISIKNRANNIIMPDVVIADMTAEIKDGNRSIFSRELSRLLRENIDNGRQSILFLNRRGYSSSVLCRDCGFTMKCPDCGIALTYHAKGDRLICHYCGYTIKNPDTCPRCNSKYIRKFGTGTQKVQEELGRLFPDCSHIRMDADTTTGKNSHENILNEFREKNINVMIGTQMIAKGHDFSNVTLVGILSADNMLNIEQYNAYERAFQLITQAAGRAGRDKIPGKVVVQAYNTDNFSIQCACKHDYEGFYRQEILFREKLNYPPFASLGIITISGEVDRKVFDGTIELKQKCFEFLQGNGMEYEVCGPARPSIQKIKRKYRWRLIIKSKSEELILKLMTCIMDGNRKSFAKNNMDISVDINPLNMC